VGTTKTRHGDTYRVGDRYERPIVVYKRDGNNLATMLDGCREGGRPGTDRFLLVVVVVAIAKLLYMFKN
jgi:hypothetical protein